MSIEDKLRREIAKQLLILFNISNGDVNCEIIYEKLSSLLSQIPNQFGLKLKHSCLIYSKIDENTINKLKEICQASKIKSSLNIQKVRNKIIS